jgi:hypothetical protein
MNNNIINFPFYDPNARRVLESMKKEMKEEDIDIGPYTEGEIKASPEFLALMIMLADKTPLEAFLDNAQKVGLAISKEQKTKLYLELLSLYYFLVGENIRKYLRGNQFTLFVMRLHVALLDSLPNTRDTWWLFGLNPLTRSKKIKEIVGEDSWKTGLSAYIHDGERFYIKDNLSEEERTDIEEFKKFFIPADAQNEYEENIILQFMIKSFYHLAKTLNLKLSDSGGVGKMLLFYSANSAALTSAQDIFKKIKPVWHIKKQDSKEG